MESNYRNILVVFCFAIFVQLFAESHALLESCYSRANLSRWSQATGQNRRSILYFTPFDEPTKEDTSSLSEKTKGVLVLLTVPLAWGTFEPAVRLVYQFQPTIPPFVFSFAYYVAAATVLNLLSTRPFDRQESPLVSSDEPQSRELHTTNTTLTVQGGFELGTYLFVGNALQVIVS